MFPKLRIRILLTCLLASIPAQEQRSVALTIDTSDAAVTRLRAAASAAPFLAVDNLFWLRPLLGQAPAADLQRHRLLAEAVIGLQWFPETALELLRDESPRIRALAAVALLRTTRGEYLEPVTALVHDEGRVPVLVPAAIVPPQDPAALQAAEERRPQVEDRTVGQFVLDALRYRRCPAPGAEGFEEFLAGETAEGATAQSLALILEFPLVAPADSSCHDPATLLAMSRELRRAPPGVQEICRIGFLGSHVAALRDHCPDLDLQLRADARRLGRDNVLRLLAGSSIEVSGRTLDYRSIAPAYEGFVRWVVDDPRRAGLDQRDAAALLKLAERSGSLTRYLAAMRVDPDRGCQIFEAAVKVERQPFRGVVDAPVSSFDLAWELFTQRPSDATLSIASWMTWTNGEVPGTRTPLLPRLHFARRLGLVEPAARRELVAAIVAAPGFATLDARIVEELAIALEVPDLPSDAEDPEHTTALRAAIRAHLQNGNEGR